MTKRPIFIPNLSGFSFVKEIVIEFKWHPGFSNVQAQKSIASLHEAAAEAKIAPILEISSKSNHKVGVSLSGFNLKMIKNERSLSVECAYQGSKVFANGGPFSDLYSASSKEAKTDERLRTSGNFVGYEFFGENFLINPVTAFYDWLYLTALSQNPSLFNQLFDFKAFSDIVFNPKKSLNTQARAAALFVSLCHQNEINRVIEDKNYYIDLITKYL
ncbi:MAG: hypothetical protein KI793_29485 [Rivularia sp. (in: Bacteria)]|nr:hypothetical protein [Rivularia sp. MS3]